MGFRQGATEDREILAEHEYETAVDRSVTRDHAIAGDFPFGHFEIRAAMFDEHVPLLEAALVE